MKMISGIICSCCMLICMHKLSAQIDQTYINELLRSNKPNLEFTKVEKLKGGLEKLFYERTYECFGDICLDMNYGLSDGQRYLMPEFDQIDNFRINHFYLRKGDSTAIINNDFKIVIQKINPILRNGSYFIFEENNNWGILDSNLHVVINPKYDSIAEIFDWSIFSDEDIFNSYKYYFKAKKGKYWAVLNMMDSIIIDFVNDELYPQLDGAIVKRNNKQGYVDSYNRIRVPVKFDSVICGFANCIVIKNNKMALYSTYRDTLVTDFNYSDYTNPSPYNCRCMKGEKGWELITASGKRIGETYDAIKNYGMDVVPVQKDGKWGFLDCQTQKVITEMKYDRILRFFGHEAIVLFQGEDMKISFDNR